jgi:glycosyltransferase involved in cell wall biosynthesis
MDSKVYVYDPTANDPLSKVRGIGRYLQILRENFSKEFIFTNNLNSYGPKVLKSSVFINPFLNFLQPPLTNRRIAKKNIAVIHDIIPLKYPQHFPAGIKGNINIFLNQFTLRLYDTIITDSETSKKDIVELLKIPEKKVVVVYPTLPAVFTSVIARTPDLIGGTKQSQKVKEIASLLSVARNDKLPTNFCLYVGDATWNKNLSTLVKAIKIINVTCVFVGKVFKDFRFETENEKLFSNPWQKELNEFIYQTLGDKRFIFPGFIPDEELVNLYERSSLNVLISRDEGFGFSYLEAASLGCPSVLSDIPTLHEISGNRGAIFANPKDQNDIANAIGELYFHPETRWILGSEAKKRSRFFSPKTFKEEFLKIVCSS